MEKKSPLDISFQSLDTRDTYQNICCLALLNQAVDSSTLKNIVDKKSKLYPKLAYALGSLGSEYLHKPIPDNDQHLVQLKDATLESFLGEFCKILEPDALPWKILYSQEPNGSNILSYMLSHALGDGVSGLDFFHSLASEKLLRGDAIQRKPKRPSYIGAVRSLIREAIGKPNFYEVNGVNSDHRELLLLSMPYDALKQLKSENSTTAYAILLALVSYLVSDYSQITGNEKYAKPLLPVSIRGKNRPMDLSNQIGGATICLPLGQHNPKELIKIIANNLKTHLNEDAYYGYYLWAYILSKFPIEFRKKLLDLSARKTSFICTNLVGPNEPLVIAGAKVEEQYVIPALMPGHGLGFGFMKSNKKMQIAIIYDPAIVTDRERLKGSLMKALSKLEIQANYEIRQS